MLSMRDFLTAHDELQRRQARKMGINVIDMQALYATATIDDGDGCDVHRLEAS